jgi:TonB family protein
VQKPAPPAPRQPAPEPPPKIEEESFTPSPHPTRRRPQIDPSDILTRPLHEKKSKVKPKENDEDSQAQDRELARAAAEARRRLMGEIGQVASAIGNSRSGPISIKLKGPGGGGLTYAPFYQALFSIYYREWIIPDGAADSDAITETEITVARDGAVVSAIITRSSGNAAVDQSVQATLDRVRRVPPLPPNSEESKMTISINFKARSQGKRAL